jgi:hypothetical protein
VHEASIFRKKLKVFAKEAVANHCDIFPVAVPGAPQLSKNSTEWKAIVSQRVQATTSDFAYLSRQV